MFQPHYKYHDGQLALVQVGTWEIEQAVPTNEFLTQIHLFLGSSGRREPPSG